MHADILDSFVVFKSQPVVLPDGVVSTSVVTKNGKIIDVKGYSYDEMDFNSDRHIQLTLIDESCII